jgi:hypothetical protein
VFVHELIANNNLLIAMRRIEQPFTPMKNSFSEETVIFSFENLSFYEEYVLRTYQCTYNEDVILICLEKVKIFPLTIKISQQNLLH